MAPPHSASATGFASDRNGTQWEARVPAFGSPETTIFIIDYDDTILASSWLAAQGLRLDSGMIPDEVTKELQVLEQAAINLLRRALELGKVALVTNAEAGWIELSARKFLPGLVPLLSQARILSARTTFEDQYPNKTQMWKNAAYDLVFAEAFKDVARAGFDGTYNVLSLGDSLYERSALLHLAGKLPNVLGKTVKLIERPSIEHLQRQLEILFANMDSLASSSEVIDLMLTVEYIEDC